MIFSILRKQIIIASIVLVSFTILLNCKKEKPEACWDGSTHVIEQHSFDTIYPSDYIMAYPGSWWEYDTGQNDTCKGWIAQITERIEKNGSCINVIEDLVYLPKTSLGKVYKGSVLQTNKDYQGTKFIELIDTEKSNSKVSWGLGSYPFGDGYGYSGSRTIKSEIIEHLDSFLVNGTTYNNVIHCKISNKLSHFKYNTPPATFTDYYFSKNIGLIQAESSFNGSSSVKKLVNHYIAPH